MKKRPVIFLFTLLLVIVFFSRCNKGEGGDPNGDPLDSIDFLPPYSLDEFVMGADLSYLNQIIEKGGDYGAGRDPYEAFKEMGTNLVRLRLWHTPDWISDVYEDADAKQYSNLQDVLDAAERAQEAEMDICLDIHYSDTWADPHKQYTPEAWKDLEIELLKDSVYAYTLQVLEAFKAKELDLAYVQIGNEINPGMLHPQGHYETNQWKNLGLLLNAGIQASRELFPLSSGTKIILHIAQPENARWFFNNVMELGEVVDFDVIGLSYYSKWSTVKLSEISGYLSTMKRDHGKPVMLVETAFPWTSDGADDYTNIMGASDSLGGYPVTEQGQLAFMQDLCQEIIDGDGLGVIYWEPGWISSAMKTQWGQGSAWENCSFFNFRNNNALLPVIDYMQTPYQFKK